ncbi:MAG TPA: hypothetical protein VFG55_04705, partial [Rhodanobacteraceae bacterium]|nr:hypothetical protein [Rhodanobacteraceae bacterium]
ACIAQSPMKTFVLHGDTLRQGDARGRHAIAPRPALAAPAAAVRGGVTSDWTALGPPGGDVADVAASPTDPDIVLAGIAPGTGAPGTLYRSTDGADNWTAVADLAGVSVYDIEFAADGTAYAATADALWTSGDDGATWTRLDLAIGLNQQVLDVALDASDPSTLWVGIGDGFGGQPVNVMRSTDGGLTWSDRTPPHAAPMTCNAIAIDPGDSDTVIAAFGGAFGGGEVWTSTDGGTTWTDRTAGLPANPMRDVVYDGTRLLVGGGQLFGSQYVGLYRSTDLGANWTELSDASWPVPVVTDVTVDPNDPDTLLASTDGAGVNRSTDGGTTWELGIGGSGALAAQSVRYGPGNSSLLLVGASSLGVFRSDNGGDDFAAASQGISELDLYSVAASPTDPDQIAVAVQGNNNGGVFSSADGGVNWTIEAVPPTRYSKVGFAPDGTLYAISSGPSTVGPEGLYRRNGDGTWTSLGPDQGALYESDLRALRFSINDPDLIFLGGADFGVAGFEVTVWRSADAGQTWTKEYEGADNDFVFDLDIVEDGTDQTVLASYDGFTDPQQGGALRSTDGGLNWDPALNGLPAFARQPKLCTALVDPATVYLSAWTTFNTGGVFTTTDGGASWTQTAASGPTIADIACDPVHAGVLYIAQGSGDAVARSGDGGDSFQPFADGLESAGTPRELAIAHADGGSSRLLMAGSKGSYATPLDDVIFANGFD